MIRKIILISLLTFFYFSPGLQAKKTGIKNKIRKEKYYLNKIKKNVPIISDELIIKYKNEIKLKKLLTKKNINHIKNIRRLKISHVRIPKKVKIEDYIRVLRKENNIEFVEPNFIIQSLNSSVNDEYYSFQWGLKKIEWERCWNISSKSGNVKVAVLDTGVSLNHEDLKDNLLPGFNFIYNNNNPYDDNGHGTMVAGIIGACINNKGIVGVNPFAKIIPIKVLDYEGYGTFFNLIEGINFAVEQGAKVLNLSLGGESYSDILHEVLKNAEANRCIIIASAGDNNNNSPLYPAAYNNVISVIDVDKEDIINPEANFSEHIDFAGPGIGIYSTHLNNNYNSASGSSLSTPFVSGLISLLIANQLDINKNEIEAILKASSDYIPDYKLKNNMQISRINAYRAMVLLKNMKETDLSIVDVKIIPESPVQGQEAKVQVIIQNQGTIKTPQTPVRLYVDDKLITTLMVRELEPNEIMKREFIWKAE